MFLETALSVYDHYFIDTREREKIEPLDEIDRDEVAFRMGDYLVSHSPLWAGFDVAIRFAKEERQQRDGENSYEAQEERFDKEREASGKKVIHIDGYGREIDKNGKLMPQKEIAEDIPSSSSPRQGCPLF